jgi:type IV secretory pathway VirB10-like protein
MLSNRLAFAALAVACIAAAAGGSYVASRHNVAAPAAAAPSTLASETSSRSTPVQETEALVGDRTLKAEAAPPPASPTEGVKRAEPPTRAAAQAPARAARPAPTPPKDTTKSSAKNSDALPTLDRTWPSGAATNAPPPSTPAAAASVPPADASTQAPRPDDRVAQQDPPRAPEPPQKTFEDLVVSADSVIGLVADTLVSSERARIEDRVEARVTRDVRVGDTVVIPAGARALGTVVQVDRGGKFKQTARLGVRFNTLVLADGTRLPITTQPFYRDGPAPGNESAAKVGGLSVGGAILGAILGGGKGAAIGAATGAAAGAGAVMAGDRSAATIAPGEAFTVKITSPVTVTIEKK